MPFGPTPGSGSGGGSGGGTTPTPASPFSPYGLIVNQPGQWLPAMPRRGSLSTVTIGGYAPVAAPLVVASTTLVDRVVFECTQEANSYASYRVRLYSTEGGGATFAPRKLVADLGLVASGTGFRSLVVGQTLPAGIYRLVITPRITGDYLGYYKGFAVNTQSTSPGESLVYGINATDTISPVSVEQVSNRGLGTMILPQGLNYESMTDLTQSGVQQDAILNLFYRTGGA